MFRSMLLAGGVFALTGTASMLPARAQTALLPKPSDNSAVVPLPDIDVTARFPGSLTVPGVEQQRRALEQTPGSVGFVDSEAYKGRFSNTLRDVLQDTPGVYVENRYGQELRLSIRGSGIARSFHLRGIELLQDGIPVNLADGSGDFYKLDPLSFRAVNVYKGGNGQAYRSSTLGGAVDFVSPTAHTAIAPNVVRLEGGSFGTVRLNAQASRVVDSADFLANGTLVRSDGYRDHATQKYAQFNANVGYRISPDVETRFYAGAYIVDQLLPGSLTLRQALQTPRMAAPAVLLGNQARDVWVERIANRTTVRVPAGQIDLDTWFIHKRLYHPIFQVIDPDGDT